MGVPVMDRDFDSTARSDSQTPSILSKAFELLGAFNHEARVMTLTELARASGLPKSTVHRLIGRLVPLGVIESHGSGFRLGIRLLPMASSMPVALMRDVALPYLANLQRWSGSNVHMAAVRDLEVVFLETFSVVTAKFPAGAVGTRLSALDTALGKSVLSHLDIEHLGELLEQNPSKNKAYEVMAATELLENVDKVRRTGVAYQCGVYHPALGNVAAPIMIRRQPMGAVSAQFALADGCSAELVNAVKVTAARISKDTTEMLDRGHRDWFPFDDSV